ncbi:16S rRNA (cytosine(1402)-N(4))-methyltransferase RsmH [Aestuariispira insulae]|uniref:Ribosomal RNA small subunit methyltransferase H n=1 Tax=Aestuariispira insulae TaxID=1461337 RepID=A0A3D9HYX3_9PROT|nr:16S rRNA (cytosine(1402)-N(4))-methyltransferase RsmH [Aestuariispira insulae]RED54106.1 16S rRNA (cytosine1402-N4)-methyltransferase [Aestuariispira insulae]
MSDTQIHKPVMLREVLETLAPTAGERYLDGTFGAGGYSRAILECADCQLMAIDRDPEALARAKPFHDDFASRFSIHEGCFGDMADIVDDTGVGKLDGIVLDIGVSSPQLDDADRGFSFREDGPLDMRMSRDGLSAADIVNSWSEDELTRIIKEFGEERFARKVARAIVHDREETPFATTLQLAGLIRRLVPKSKDGIDPATRTFQGLRIAVNDELGELDRALQAAENLLKPGGRLVVVSFHSLEDRRVKNFLKDRSSRGSGVSRYAPITADEGKPPSFKLINRKPMKAAEDELKENPRARSALLRAAVRTDAPSKNPEGTA